MYAGKSYLSAPRNKEWKSTLNSRGEGIFFFKDGSLETKWLKLYAHKLKRENRNIMGIYISITSELEICVAPFTCLARVLTKHTIYTEL